MDASKVVRRKISLFAILSKREVDKIFNLVSDEVRRKTTYVIRRDEWIH